jgi:UbiD family decarboxylase
MQLTDLPQYIEALRNLEEIQDVSAPVSLNLEVGAIIRRCTETGAPAPLFNAFSDHPPGFRILGAPAATSAQRELELVRAATSLELPPTSSGPDIAEAITANLDLPAVDPEIVEYAPCFENVSTGDDVDLTRLPVPLLHDDDGGRYLNTFGCIVARTPDGSWTNWSIARIMLVDGKRMTGLVAPEQHIGIVSRAWADIGKPMPFALALALGVEPSIPFICAMPLRARASEGGRLGALMRRPIKTVRC